MRLIPTILCGGAGSRLWPLSRELYPKPFITLADGQSLLQKAFLRGASIPDVTEVLTVTNQELLFTTKDHFSAVNKGSIATSYILEPYGRNTAPAIAAAARLISKKYGEDTILLVLAADHLIADPVAFTKAVMEAARLAGTGKLVTFGIKPTTPETGYGYIEAKGSHVARFVEKPSLTEATAYVASGNYLWNSGIFCFTAGTILREMDKYCPDLLHATDACIKQSSVRVDKHEEILTLNAESFRSVLDISIDYAVMEKSTEVAVVHCDIGWNDIGSWNALGALTLPDKDGNRIQGDVALHNVSNCYIQSGERMVGAVGVENLLIIDTPDALLVAHRDHAQDVKQLYAKLKTAGSETHKLHRTVHRPWGNYTVLNEGPGFKIKRIEVNPGANLSLQMHHHRSEHWIVINGVAKIINGEEEFLINANESTYIPSGHKHRLSNPKDEILTIIEVQNGNYLGEDDIVRFDDHYGRNTKSA